MLPDRISLILEHIGLSQKEFAKEVGVTPGYVTELLKGRSGLSQAILIKIREKYGINLDWLLMGEGLPFVETQGAISVKPLSDPLDDLGKRERKIVEDMISILSKRSESAALQHNKGENYSHSEQREIVELGSVAAGRLNAEETPTGKKILFPRALIPDRGPLYALRVRGDSMIGANIHAGDLAIFRPAPHPQELQQGAIVVALVNGENTLKRLYRSDHSATLRAANDRYPDIPVQRFDDLVIQGELRYLLKKVGE